MQLEGRSRSGTKGWCFFDLSKAKEMKIVHRDFAPTREGYKINDKYMTSIYCPGVSSKYM